LPPTKSTAKEELPISRREVAESSNVQLIYARETSNNEDIDWNANPTLVSGSRRAAAMGVSSGWVTQTGFIIILLLISSESICGSISFNHGFWEL
jgi:hypothetical protein